MTIISLKVRSGILMGIFMWDLFIWAKSKDMVLIFTRQGMKSMKESFQTIYGMERVI